jgi:hypothetical protein
MVLNFGLTQQDSSRHLSISNHRLRKVGKDPEKKKKKRLADPKDYEDDSDDDSSIASDTENSENVGTNNSNFQKMAKGDPSSNKAAEVAAAVAQIRSNLNTGD